MAVSKYSLWAFIVLVLSGCVMSPGMDSMRGGGQSKVALPSIGDRAPEQVAVTTIDAQLILDMRRAQSEKLRGKNSSKQSAPEKPQQQTPSGPNATLGPVMQAKTAPMAETVKAISPGASYQEEYDYLVGPSDILTIIVWEHPDLTIPAGAERSAEQAGTVVSNKGTIFFPYAGLIHVAGKTLDDIRDMLTVRLSRYIEDVKLDVRVAQYNHKRVYVVGEVEAPGVQKITNTPPTILEMISAAGGFTDNADSFEVTLTRNDKTYRVDLLSLYEDGNTSQNILLQDGDVVHVNDNIFNKVFVLGEVQQPGSLVMNKRRKSLAEALGDTGGVNPLSSNPGHVFVFRFNPDKGSSIFRLDASSPESMILADQFALKPRDVVYVDTAKVVRWNRVIQNISGTIGTLNSASGTDFPLFNGSNQ